MAYSASREPPSRVRFGMGHQFETTLGSEPVWGGTVRAPSDPSGLLSLSRGSVLPSAWCVDQAPRFGADNLGALGGHRASLPDGPKPLALLPMRRDRNPCLCPGLVWGLDQRASLAGAITPRLDHSSSWFLTASAAVASGLSSRKRRKWFADD